MTKTPLPEDPLAEDHLLVGEDPSDVCSESDSESETEHDAEPESASERVERHLRVTHARWRNLSESRVAGVLNALERIDKLLVWVDRLLYLTQPPATGRIRIAWEKDPSDEERHFPLLVKWIKGKGGRWRYVRLVRPTRAVHGRGGFATHRSEVVKLVQIGMELLKDRSALVGYLARLGQGWTQKSQVLSEKELELLEEMLVVVDQVNAKGKVRIIPGEVLV